MKKLISMHFLIQILDQYFLKDILIMIHTSVHFQNWYSVFCKGTATYAENCNQTFVSSSNIACQFPTLIGDGFCQDYNNNRHCSFDGGDCCGPCVNREFCTECKCKTGDTDKITNARVGNGFCNDETNIEGCNFDGGDCCGTCVNSKYCSVCACFWEISGNIMNDFLPDNFNWPNCSINLRNVMLRHAIVSAGLLNTMCVNLGSLKRPKWWPVANCYCFCEPKSFTNLRFIKIVS